MSTTTGARAWAALIIVLILGAGVAMAASGPVRAQDLPVGGVLTQISTPTRPAGARAAAMIATTILAEAVVDMADQVAMAARVDLAEPLVGLVGMPLDRAISSPSRRAVAAVAAVVNPQRCQADLVAEGGERYSSAQKHPSPCEAPV